jgi:hypothetical protein
VLVPVAAVVAKPLEFTDATPTFDELQVTCVLRFSVDPSLKLPTAVNCTDPPAATEGLLGVTVIDVSVALVTVNPAVPNWPANRAVIVALPGETPVAKPLVSVESPTVATDEGAEDQDAEPVRFCILPSAKFPIAVN